MPLLVLDPPFCFPGLFTFFFLVALIIFSFNPSFPCPALWLVKAHAGLLSTYILGEHVRETNTSTDRYRRSWSSDIAGADRAAQRIVTSSSFCIPRLIKVCAHCVLFTQECPGCAIIFRRSQLQCRETPPLVQN